MPALVRGVHAAIFTPRFEDGSIAYDVLRRHTKWLLESGVDGVVVGGATAEYPYASEEESRLLVEAVAAIAGRNRFIAGIGGGTVQQCIRQGNHAIDAGALALLLPAPHFFHYSQEDVTAFAQAVAAGTPGPVLLYQLPQFTNGYSLETVLALIDPSVGITGIKDSSGSLDTLRALTQGDKRGVSCIVGNDSALVAARREGVCDAVISGVAAALPELIMELFASTGPSESVDNSAQSALLDEVILRLNRFPVPWGLKWIAEARGLGPFGQVLPVSASQRAEALALVEWLDGFWPRLSRALENGVLTVAGSNTGSD